MMWVRYHLPRSTTLSRIFVVIFYYYDYNDSITLLLSFWYDVVAVVRPVVSPPIESYVNGPNQRDDDYRRPTRRAWRLVIIEVPLVLVPTTDISN